MGLFLVCKNDGSVVSVERGDSFKEVYQDTVGKNYGEFLVELDEDTLLDIKEMNSGLKMYKITYHGKFACYVGASNEREAVEQAQASDIPWRLVGELEPEFLEVNTCDD